MKLLPTASAIILSVFVLSSCGGGDKDDTSGDKPKKEDNGGGGASAEDKALDAFKEQVKSLDLTAAVKAVDAAEETAEEDPAGMFKTVFDLSDKLNELKTDGVPDDLKTATETLQTTFSGMVTHIKAMPIPMDVVTEGEAGIEAWVGEKMAEDPAFIAEFGQNMQTWEAKMTELGETMEAKGDEIEAVYKKYEIPMEFPEDEEEGG